MSGSEFELFFAKITSFESMVLQATLAAVRIFRFGADEHTTVHA